jgi:hypothetical protein
VVNLKPSSHWQYEDSMFGYKTLKQNRYYNKQKNVTKMNHSFMHLTKLDGYVTQDLKLIQASWAKYGNSIMINGWNDMKQQKNINKSLLQSILAFAAGIPPCMYGNRPLSTLLHGYLLAGTSNISKSLFNQSKGSISRCAVRY